MADASERSSERSAHAIYGMIIITSALVADRLHLEDTLTALFVVWGAGIVLLLAHIYSAFVAETGTRGKWLTHSEQHLLIVDNVPVLTAMVVPTVLISLAGVGLMELRIAVDISIVSAVVALFAVGLHQSRQAGASAVSQLALGTLGAVVGLLVIALEVLLGH